MTTCGFGLSPLTSTSSLCLDSRHPGPKPEATGGVPLSAAESMMAGGEEGWTLTPRSALLQAAWRGCAP